MNISSLIVMAAEGAAEGIINEIRSISGCEVPVSENNKLIVSLECDNIESASGKMKQIERIDGVIAARFVYSYSEEELDAARHNIELSEDFPEWLNRENIKAKEIPYSGRLKF
ncbi:MAG: chaperone NapD [Bacteroidota bacterium]